MLTIRLELLLVFINPTKIKSNSFKNMNIYPTYDASTIYAIVIEYLCFGLVSSGLGHTSLFQTEFRTTG